MAEKHLPEGQEKPYLHIPRLHLRDLGLQLAESPHSAEVHLPEEQT